MEPNEVDINAPSEKIQPGFKNELEKSTNIPTPTVSEPAKKPFAFPDEHESHVHGVRTYSSDLAEAIKDSKGSVIKIAIAENERRQKERKELEDAPKKNALFAVGSILIILIAMAVFYGIFWYKKNSSIAPIVVAPRPTTIIKSEFSENLDVAGMTRTQIIPAIREKVLTPNIRPGTIKNISIVQENGQEVTQVTASKFLRMLDTHASDDFVRSLSNEFMVGIYLYDKSNLFLVLTGQSHDYLLSGIINWEPFLFEDLAPMFGFNTMGDSAKYNDTNFTDVLIENREARAIVDENNKPLFFYTFIDPDTIFIATDPKTLTQSVIKMRSN